MGVVRKSSVCANVTDGSVAMSRGLELGPADLKVMKRGCRARENKNIAIPQAHNQHCH
jgi:hypothetical protein